MKVLIADDDRVCRHVLERTLTGWGHEVRVCADGDEAWDALQETDPTHLLVLDWMMPGMDGTDVCRKIRAEQHFRPCYIILLTAKGRREDIVAGLQAGADDYLIKPLQGDELRARVQVGIRVIELELTLSNRIRELEDSLSRVRRLRGLLPICSYCKKVRNDNDYWQQVESYIAEHADVQFTHGICPECYADVMGSELQRATP